MTRRWRRRFERHRDEEAARDAEESLVAALEESDTAVETMHDTGADGRTQHARVKAWRVGAAGLVLAALGMFVTRRRR